MADIMLTHSASGTTWSKDRHSYIKREKKNGKWVYTYQKLGRNYTPSSKDVSELQRFAQNEAKTRSSISDRDAQQIQSKAESMKRQSVSAQRNVQKDPRYKVEAKAAYLKNKASRAARKNLAKGKKKVSEILTRLKKKYIVGEPGKVYPVNSAKEKAKYKRIRRKKMRKSRKFIEDYIIGHEGKVTTY